MNQIDLLRSALPWAKRVAGRTYSNPDILLRGGRADASAGIDLAPHLESSINSWIEQALSPKPEDAAATADLCRRFLAGDPDAVSSVNRLRVTTVNNFVAPMAKLAAAFFNIETLADDEAPVIKNTTGNEVTFRQISEDGHPQLCKMSPSASTAHVSLAVRWSEKVPYPLRDVYLGRSVSDFVLSTVDIARDLALDMDGLCKTLLDTSFGAFTTTGSKKARTYNAHSSVQTGNLPTTNDLTISGSDTGTDFTTLVMKEAVRYCDKWGGLLGDLRPTGLIFVPSADSGGLLDEISVGGSQNNPTANGILGNYTSVNYAGVTWTLVPMVTLAPNRCYVQLSQKVGTIYRKPGMDEVIDNAASEEAKRANRAERAQSYVYGMTINAAHKPFALRIRYRTDS